MWQKELEVNAQLKGMGLSGSASADEAGHVTSANVHWGTVPEEFIPFLLAQPRLKSLSCGTGGLTDEQFARLIDLKDRVEVLDLHHPEMTDSALETIGQFTRLRKLQLPPQITDLGVLRLGKLTELEDLAMLEAKVTDVSVPTLKGLSKLTQLNLVGTRVSSVGVAELAAALPNCRIVTPEGDVAGKQ